MRCAVPKLGPKFVVLSVCLASSPALRFTVSKTACKELRPKSPYKVCTQECSKQECCPSTESYAYKKNTKQSAAGTRLRKYGLVERVQFRACGVRVTGFGVNGLKVYGLRFFGLCLFMG